MSKLKNLVTGAMLIGSVAATKAQQTLQKITEGSNETIVELFQVRNGTNNNNTVGNGGYDQGMSQPQGTNILYLDGEVYDPRAGSALTPIPHVDEEIGNGTFELADPQPHDTNTAVAKHDWRNGEENPREHGEITINQYDQDLDAIEDSNTNIDVFKTRRVLPHTLDNGDPIPNNLRIIVRSREGEKDTGGSHSGKRIGFVFNGTKWVQETHDPFGDPYDVLQGTEVLGVNDVDGRSKGQAYPNPTRDNIRLNDGDLKSNELLDYAIYDMTGKQVGNGTAREDQDISLSKNPQGIYIIRAKDDDGNVTTHKVIKK